MVFSEKNITCLDILVFVFAVAIGSCAKNQFFYIPFLIAMLIPFLENSSCKEKKIILFLLLLIQVFSVVCIKYSQSSTNINKYHSTYFGAAIMAKNKGLNLKNIIDYECIGIDAWGSKYDFDEGAIRTNLNTFCYDKYGNDGFKKTLKIYTSYPTLLIFMLNDDGIANQFKSNYFHVYKNKKLIVNKSSCFTTFLDDIKDNLNEKLKVFFPLVIFCVVIIFNGFKKNKEIFLLFLIFYSQIYMSFLGEGYRDLSKHLFLANLCLDFMVVILIWLGIKKLSRDSVGLFSHH